MKTPFCEVYVARGFCRLKPLETRPNVCLTIITASMIYFSIINLFSKLTHQFLLVWPLTIRTFYQNLLDSIFTLHVFWESDVRLLSFIIVDVWPRLLFHCNAGLQSVT